MLTKVFTAARVQQNKHVAGVVLKEGRQKRGRKIACLALTDAFGQANKPILIQPHYHYCYVIEQDGRSCISTIQQQLTALEREEHSVATV
jgi:hypothetical protein